MIASLSSLTPGSPDNAFERLFQFGAQTLSSGGVMGLGDGTESLLYLDDAGIGIKNAGGELSTLRTLATTTRAVNLADAGGELFPAEIARLSSDSTNSTVTPTAVSSWGVSLESDALYEFEILLLLESAGATISPKWDLTGPSAQTSWIYYRTEGQAVTAAEFTSFGASGTNAVNPPGAATPYAVKIRGVLKTTGTTPASDVGLDLYSELGGTAVTLKAGSLMAFRKIN